MIETTLIRQWLERFESRELVAYVPCRHRNYTGRNSRSACGEVLGVSGVTVGTGLDLGQQRLEDLERMGLDAGLRTLLRPYLGLQKEAACRQLKAAPLKLTETQCAAIDEAVHEDYIRRAGATYNSRAMNGSFEELPGQAQTVVVSLFYQLGRYDGNPGYPKLWGHLVRQDWAAAADELEHGFARYASRRRQEAALLRELC